MKFQIINGMAQSAIMLHTASLLKSSPEGEGSRAHPMEKKIGPWVFLVCLLLSAALLLSLFWAYLSAIVLALLIVSAFFPIFLRTKKLLKGCESLASLVIRSRFLWEEV